MGFWDDILGRTTPEPEPPRRVTRPAMDPHRPLSDDQAIQRY